MERNPAAARAAIVAALGVALGAFGTHALRDRLTAADLKIWETAVAYHQLHAVAAFFLALTVKGRYSDLFLLGILFFSGSLYALVGTGTRILGAVTPIGGAIFIGTWIALAIRLVRSTPTPDRR